MTCPIHARAAMPCARCATINAAILTDTRAHVLELWTQRGAGYLCRIWHADDPPEARGMTSAEIAEAVGLSEGRVQELIRRGHSLETLLKRRYHLPGRRPPSNYHGRPVAA